MMTLLIARLTFREAFRRKLVLAVVFQPVGVNEPHRRLVRPVQHRQQ